MKCILALIIVIGLATRASSLPINCPSAKCPTISTQNSGPFTDSLPSDMKFFFPKLKEHNENIIEATKKELANSTNSGHNDELVKLRKTVADIQGEVRVLLSQLIAQQEDPEMRAHIGCFEAYNEQINELVKEIDHRLEESKVVYIPKPFQATMVIAILFAVSTCLAWGRMENTKSLRIETGTQTSDASIAMAVLPTHDAMPTTASASAIGEIDTVPPIHRETSV